MTKKQIRLLMKQQRSELSSEERGIYDKAIREQLFSLQQYKDCSCLFTFLSFGSEPDTKKIIARALSEYKKVYIPRVEPQGMEFYEIHDLNGLIPSEFGVMEPFSLDESRYRKPLSEQEQYNLKLMLLPGLAFDPYGNRIGYGAGYYDRYLSMFSDDFFYKTALAFDFQLLDKIEVNEYDKKADIIITPTQIIRV